jgi:hypothetical protein
MTVTLQMMINSLRSSPVINAHCRWIKQVEVTVPIAESSKNGDNHPVSNITLEFFILGVTYLLKNESYMYSTDL